MMDHIGQLEKEIDDIKNSLSYKVGRLITFPARKVYDFLDGLSDKKETPKETAKDEKPEIAIKNPLWEYFQSNNNRLIHKWIHYFDIYHKHFNRFRDKPCVIVEIGISEGGSLEMWRNYFGDKAMIYGIDVDPRCKTIESDKIKIFIGSQSDRDFLRSVKAQLPPIDILIDDGGHTMEQQIVTFEELYDHLSENGIYLCEDTHTSYWDEFGGGLEKEGTFIEYAKKRIDQLNAWHIRDNQLPVDSFTQNTTAIHFYDSIVVFEKGKREKPHAERRGFTIDEINKKKIQSLTIDQLKLHILGLDFEDPSLMNITKESDISTLPSSTQKVLEGKIWPEIGETMVGIFRLNNVEYCTREIIKNHIEGDFIETGVWRGGVCIFMRALLNEFGIKDKKVWVADSFEGLPMPNEEAYPEDKNDKLYTFKQLAIPLEQVKENFNKYGLLDNQVEFLKGWFKNTLPTIQVDKIALLRLDGDMYESTMDALTNLYPKLQKGGFIIIDDYGCIPACRKAVSDYRDKHHITSEIIPVDWTGVYWMK